MRAGLPIAVLVALLALVAGAALWLSRADGTAAAPVARAAPEPGVSAQASTPELAAGTREGRAEAVAPEPDPARDEVETDEATEPPVGDAAIAGWLLVDGGPPGEAVALSLAERESHPVGSWGHVQEVECAPDGSFRFEGLSDDWIGAVLLPLHYRRPGVEAGGMEDRTIPVRAGDVGLRIAAERLPTLRGRVLGPLDRAPIPGIQVDVRAHWGHRLTMSGGLTDGSGRFQLLMNGETLQELTVECKDEDGASFVRTWEPADLPPPGAHGDIDLGDLALRSARTAWLTVLDPEGAPVEGARVVERGTLNRHAYATDADGRVALQLLTAPEGFEVQARGYAMLEVPAPAPGAEVQVRLSGTNRLTIEIVDAAGEAAGGCELRLSAAAAPFEGGREWQDDFLMAEGDAFSGGGRSSDRVFTEFRTGADGRLELQGLTVGLPLELSACDRLGHVGASVTCRGLAAGEVRELRLVLERPLQRVSGRCSDRDGAPIAGARVVLGEDHESLTLETDADGRFTGPELFAGELRLRASAPGFSDLVIDGLVQLEELELVLERGRVLVVELRDARGGEVDVGTLEARSLGYEGAWSASRTGLGQRTFVGLPLAPLELVHQWHGRSHAAQVDGHAEAFRFELPALGALEVRADAVALGPDESAAIVLASLDDDRGAVEQRPLPTEGAFEHTYAPWPGRYRLRRVVQAWKQVGNGFREPLGSRELGEPIEVEVRAGETTRVVLP